MTRTEGLRRFLLMVVGYAVGLGLLALAHVAGLVSGGSALAIATVTVVTNVAFFAAFRSGFAERFRDPNLLWPQTVAATLVFATVIYHFEYDRGLALLLAFGVVAIGLFRHVDVRDLSFAQHLLVPGFQAAVLALAVRSRPRRGLSRAADLARRPLLWALLSLVNWAGETWWVWGFALLFGFQILMLILYPKVILPLFNKLTLDHCVIRTDQPYIKPLRDLFQRRARRIRR